MKKIVYVLAVIALTFSSCSLSNINPSDSTTTTGGTTSTPASPTQSTDDDNAIQAYLKANNITATKDPSGLYYKIITPGTGATPTLSSTITIRYTGSLLNGIAFDQATTPVDFKLSSLITGWQIGLPLIKEGGHITLILPSALGYGTTSPSANVPSNSVLVFDVILYSVK